MRQLVRIDGQVGSLVCDDRRRPFVLVRWLREIELDLVAGFDHFADRLFADLEANDERIVLFVDVNRCNRPSPEARRALVDLRQRHFARMQRLVLLDLVIVDSVAMRGTLAALNWIKPKIGAEGVATLDVALERGRAALARAGLPAPSLRATDFD